MQKEKQGSNNVAYTGPLALLFYSYTQKEKCIEIDEN